MTQDIRSCDLCGVPMIPLWKVDDAHGVCWNYVSCPQCEFIRLSVDLSDQSWLSCAYPSTYYGEGYSKFRGAIQILRKFSALRRAREIHRIYGKSGAVLDIGCGEGLFLQSMKSLGWSVQGCETGPQAADRAEKNLGQPIHRKDFDSMPPSQRPWDIVFVWHVLEHLEKPQEFFEKIAKETHPKSLVVIAIPNAQSWQARIFGPHWFHLDPPRHLTHMGLTHLNQVAKKCGWKVEATHHFSLEYNPFGWAQSLLNAMGWKRDAMYETLKNRKGNQTRSLFWRILAWILLGPSVVPALFEAMAGRGGCICCYLRKAEIQPPS
jgi:2-polyprenyl-3-methyl-5-hydroxy-6-metoxy-1,4-benzoquinol methylase